MSPDARDAPLPDPTPLEVPSDLPERLAALGVTLPAPVIARIAEFLARLLAMNERFNLTAITEPSEVWTRHVLDTASLLPPLAGLSAGARVLDLGSGGGVPGVILALARPDLRFTLVEATRKKATFLSAVVDAMGLANVQVVPERAEKLGPEHTGQDVLTARAVARLVELVPWAAPLVRPGGRMLFIKGERAEAELIEARGILRKLGCRHLRTVLTPTGRVVVIKR